MHGCGILKLYVKVGMYIQQNVICFDYYDLKAGVALHHLWHFSPVTTLTECTKSITYLKATLNSEEDQ